MRRAQATLEYVCLIGLVAAALVALLVYISRGFQGRVRLQANTMGEQYSPRNMSTDFKQTTTVDYVDEVKKDETWSDTTNITTTTGGSYERVRDFKYE